MFCFFHRRKNPAKILVERIRPPQNDAKKKGIGLQKKRGHKLCPRFFQRIRPGYCGLRPQRRSRGARLGVSLLPRARAEARYNDTNAGTPTPVQSLYSPGVLTEQHFRASQPQPSFSKAARIKSRIKPAVPSSPNKEESTLS